MERMISGATVMEEKHCSLVPPSWEDTVRTVRIDESAAAGVSLAHAFATDSLSQYLLDGDDMAGYSAEARWKLHVVLMTTVVASHAYKGLVTTIGPDYDALAIWYIINSQHTWLSWLGTDERSRAPPGADPDGLWTMLRSGIIKLYLQLPAEGRKRYFKELLPLLHRTKGEVLRERDENSYYLVYIGTKPSARGRGYATKLIQDMIVKVRNVPARHRRFALRADM